MVEQDTFTQLIGDFFFVTAAGVIVVFGVVSAFKLYDLVRDTLRKEPPGPREMLFRTFIEDGRQVVKWKRLGDREWRDVQVLEGHEHE